MAKLILLIGNIGTGKTTYAKKELVEKYKAFLVCPDDYIQDEKESKSVRMVREIESNLGNGINVIVDGCNIKKFERQYYFLLCRKPKAELIAYDFGKGSAKSLSNRLEDNRGVDAEIWVSSHKANIEEYEPPTLEEGFKEVYTVKQ